ATAAEMSSSTTSRSPSRSMNCSSARTPSDEMLRTPSRRKVTRWPGCAAFKISRPSNFSSILPAGAARSRRRTRALRIEELAERALEVGALERAEAIDDADDEVPAVAAVVQLHLLAGAELDRRAAIELGVNRGAGGVARRIVDGV